MLLIPLFCIVLVWYLIVCYKWKKNILDHMEKIPGLKWYPIFGTSYTYLDTTRQNVLYRFAENALKYGSFSKGWSSNIPEVHITKPDDLQVVLRSSAHTAKGPFYQFLFPWLGEGVFLSEGAKWFMQRKLLTPTFHFKILEGMVETFGDKATQLTENLAIKANGQYFNMIPEVQLCTLSVICETSMGVTVEAITDNPLEYCRNIHEITEMAMWRYWRPYVIDPIFYLLPQGRTFKRNLKHLHDFSGKVIKHKRQTFRSSNSHVTENGEDIDKKQTSFLDLVMDATENKNTMSDTDLRALVDTFLLAGFETTTNTICWTLFLLGNNPEIQDKLYEEVRTVLKGKSAPASISEISELKYTECVVKEAMRLYPILPFITRDIKEEVNIGGYKVVPGTQAILHIFLAQRNPEYYPEPNKFDPERFTPENSKNRHPFAYIPFSAGPRNCLGMRFALLELKTVVATIINKFKITSLETAEEIKLYADVFIRPQTGINLKLEPRQE